MKLKVLVADKFPEKYIQQMKDLDLDVAYEPKLGEKDLPEAEKDVDIPNSWVFRLSKLKLVKAERIVKALAKIGFISIRQHGSHLVMKHPDGRITVVPMHKEKKLGIVISQGREISRLSSPYLLSQRSAGIEARFRSEHGARSGGRVFRKNR